MRGQALAAPRPNGPSISRPLAMLTSGMKAGCRHTWGELAAKLRPEWFQQVLLNRAAARPYQATRMPQYGQGNVGSLHRLFAQADPPSGSDDPGDGLADAKWGRKLTGTGGLSCISCHNYGEHKSLGVPADEPHGYEPKTPL